MEKSTHAYVVMLNDKVFVADPASERYTLDENRAGLFHSAKEADEIAGQCGGQIGRVTLNIEILSADEVWKLVQEETNPKGETDHEEASAPAQP